jgi:hypothetical protein
MISTGKSKEELTATPGGSPVRQIAVFLQNRVGALKSLVKLLHDHKIEVLGLTVQESTELTLARLVLSDPESAETIFMEKGIAFASSTIVVAELRDAEEMLGGCLAALLAAEINIHVCYPLLVRPRGRPLLALYLDEPEMGAEALNKAGFKVLMQEELSR